jgi:hypothetical protein
MKKAITIVLITFGLFSAAAPAAFATGGPPRCVDCK